MSSLETYPKASDSLSLSLSNAESFSDLKRVDFSLPGVGREYSVQVSINEFAVERKYAGNGEQVSGWMVINPFALPVGPHTITVTIPEAGVNTTRQFSVSHQGRLAQQVSAQLLRKNTCPVTFEGLDSTTFDYSDKSVAGWFDREDGLNYLQELEARGVDEATLKSLEQFYHEGYCVLPFKLEPALAQQAKKDLEQALAEGYQGIEPGSSQRMELLHHRFESIGQIWSNPQILGFLDLVYNDQARPCQTLCFINGSQQALHQDGLYLTPFPSGYMCGLWIALEKVVQGAGELMVVPGSHRLHRLYRKDLPTDISMLEYERLVTEDLYRQIEMKGMKPVSYLPEEGQILIWHERLLHGGAARQVPDQTRKSFVAHYFSSGCVGYYDSSRHLAYKHTRA